MKWERICLLVSLACSVTALAISLAAHRAATAKGAADFDCVTVINHLNPQQRSILDSHALTLVYRDAAGVPRFATLDGRDLQALKSNLPDFQVVD